MQRTLAKLKSTIAALLIAVLAVLPVADAFACSFELFDVHTATTAGNHTSPLHDSADKADGSGDMHGACAHGHCHHSAANISSGTALDCAPMRSRPGASLDTPRPSELLEQPLRPPRG
ncbi:hypothetical protein CO611_01935 [Lysobacteraceae bacterium NML03-0222]|nr:hypothetical protein [Pseudomonadota bacterium]PJK01843.1 hypothetical protein CO611_01935 [Xanthomonadaceae bacterium NML03-0222]PJK04009.1 hypothetical protein CO612_07835 [Xanthomonadaceae bacterium NML71-0210]PJK09838.1 hypothetical protein CO608_03720 [Xanthomonadaceae bacterium NML08-0793]